MRTAVEVVAINNEKMVVPVDQVRMVGPLMDRGIAMLGRSVLYMDGLPPLPIKETRQEITGRLGWEVNSVADDQEGTGDSDGRSDSGAERGALDEA